MLKKILFITISLLVGMLILSQAMYSNFYSVFRKQTSDAVKNEEYLKAERYYSFVMSEEKKETVKIEGTDIVIEVYPTLNQNMRKYVIDKEKETYGQYQTLETGLQISIFNLPSEFALKDTPDNKDTADINEEIKGGVTLVYSDGVTQTYDFYDENTGISYYGYADFYSFLPMSVYYEDFINHENKTSEGAYLTGLVLSDGSGKTSYEVDLTTQINFDTELHATFSELTTDYNNLQKVVIENKKVDENAITKIYNKINEIAQAENSGFYSQHNVTIVYKSGSFITKMIIALVIFLGMDGLLGFFLFRNRKPKVATPQKNIRPANRPVNSTKPVRPQSNPEQFNRKDLFGEDNKKQIIEANKEIVKEEVVDSKEESKTENK